MKVTKKHNDGTTMFCTLKTGDTFLFENEVYLKFEILYPENGEYVNAICLNDGDMAGFNAETRVKIVEAELIVEV